MRFRFNGRPQKLHSRFPSWNYHVHPAKNSKTLTRFYSYLNTSTDWENKFQTAWSRQRPTTIHKFLPSSSYNHRNNLPIFESFQRRDLAQETQIPFQFFPPFVRSKAMSFAYGKVFFSSRKKSSYAKMLPDWAVGQRFSKFSDLEFEPRFLLFKLENNPVAICNRNRPRLRSFNVTFVIPCSLIHFVNCLGEKFSNKTCPRCTARENAPSGSFRIKY